MPSGEVFTGPVETSATGRVRFTIPSSPAGVEVSGVELELRGGEVVGARADEGEEYLHRALATDDGARRIGELGIGTNFGIDRPIGTILFDEKDQRNGAPRARPLLSGDRRQERQRPALGPDLRPAAGGRLSADGETIMQDGDFVWPFEPGKEADRRHDRRSFGRAASHPAGRLRPRPRVPLRRSVTGPELPDIDTRLAERLEIVHDVRASHTFGHTWST
jgi:hypothetical protein